MSAATILVRGVDLARLATIGGAIFAPAAELEAVEAGDELAVFDGTGAFLVTTAADAPVAAPYAGALIVDAVPGGRIFPGPQNGGPS